MTDQEFIASPEMRKFFERLLSLKSEIREKAEENDDLSLWQVYWKLESIIKEAK